MISPISRLQNMSRPFNDIALLSDAQGEADAYDIRVAETLADAASVFQLVYSYWNAVQVSKKVSRLLVPLSSDGVSVEAILGAVIFENAAH